MHRHRGRCGKLSPTRRRHVAFEQLEPRCFLSLAPTTAGIADVYVNENAAPYTVSLSNAFYDSNGGYGGLSYAVVNNSNPALFSSVAANGYGGLVLGFAANAYGGAAITVQATDSGGLSAQTSFQVYVNAPPQVASGISNVYVNENAAPYTVSLSNAFYQPNDGYGGSGGLSYAVVNNSNPALFSSAAANGYGGLVLGFAANAYGGAAITVQATDSGGLSAQTSFQVYVNAPPQVASGISNVYVNENAAPYTVSLSNAFYQPNDGYGGYGGLSYAVVNNSNPSLFNSVAANGYGGLVLGFAANAYGGAAITVQATDSGGLSAQTSFQVYVNAPPQVASGIPDVYVNENAAPYTVSLSNAFYQPNDGYGGSGGLSYQVVNNSNPALFSSAAANGYGGLVLGFAANAYGGAAITVQATDSGGLSAQTSFHVYVNGAPQVASRIPDVYVNENAAPYTVSLSNAFYQPNDGYGGSGGLSYAVVNDSNPALFSSVAANGYGGLVLDFAANAYGGAAITVQATDSGGLSVQTSFAVHVNAPPVVSDFGAVQGYGDMWTFSGQVTDPDEPVAGLTVYFGGVLAPYSVQTTVDANGLFSLTADFPNLGSGTATAWCYDSQGAQSNVDWYEIA
jgi:hypothetical protein